MSLFIWISSVLQRDFTEFTENGSMMIKRLFKGLLVLIAVFVLGLLASLSFLRRDREVDLVLPEPHGPFGVSRLTEMWTDQNRTDPFVDAPAGSHTELFVWIWYPSTQSPGQKPADYLPLDWRRELDARQNVLSFLTRDLSAVHPHSRLDGAVAAEKSRYPIVILRGGLGALVADYTVLAEDLASHGYIVVGFDAPYRTVTVVFPGGRVVTRPPSLNPETLNRERGERLVAHLLSAWVSDIGFVLDRLKRLNDATSGRFSGRLDLQKIGIVGHSLGGAAAAQFSHDDTRCSAGIDLDGALYQDVVREGLHRPFMFLLSDHHSAKDSTDRQIAADIKSVYDRLPLENRLGFSIAGANHFSFSDQMLLRNQTVISLLQRVMGLNLESRRGLAITTETIHRFLDVQLKDAPPESLHTLQEEYPELKLFAPVNEVGR